MASVPYFQDLFILLFLFRLAGLCKGKGYFYRFHGFDLLDRLVKCPQGFYDLFHVLTSLPDFCIYYSIVVLLCQELFLKILKKISPLSDFTGGGLLFSRRKKSGVDECHLVNSVILADQLLLSYGLIVAQSWAGCQVFFLFIC